MTRVDCAGLLDAFMVICVEFVPQKCNRSWLHFITFLVVSADFKPNAEAATEIQNSLYGLPLEAVSADPAIVLVLAMR